MEPTPPKNTGSLENQLRNMILSNVHIAPEEQGQTNRGGSIRGARGGPRGGFRGRGRGGAEHFANTNPSEATRGGFTQGPRGGAEQFATPNRGQTNRGGFIRGPRGGAHQPVNTHSDRGQYVSHQQNWRQQRPPRPQHPHSQEQQPQQSQDQVPQTGQAPQDGEVPPAGQTPHARQIPSNAPNAGQVPRILQRPQPQTGSASHPTTGPRPYPPRQNGFRPNHAQVNQPPQDPMVQVQFLDSLAAQEVSKVEISITELDEKEAFRVLLEEVLNEAIAKEYSGDLATIQLINFGSLASGFATPGSDMDLAIVPVWKDQMLAQSKEMPQVIPRILERAVLESGMGGRLLTRTRVPILKICQQPSEALFTALCDERKKWEELPEEEKYIEQSHTQATAKPKPLIDIEGDKAPGPTVSKDPSDIFAALDVKDVKPEPSPEPTASPKATVPSPSQEAVSKAKEDKPREKAWLREKVLGPLDFPKTGVGIQCDINFSNLLGIHNTHLLRCYSLCDPRVRPMVLFVKAWAKRRKINSSYSGTLSSYGWVLMVLHYLVNIAEPPVCPNLQLAWRPPTDLNMEGLEQMFKATTIQGYAVRFWRNEPEILHAARSGQLTRNQESVGSLLRGFFKYFAALNSYGPGPRRSFYWTTEVLSLRTPGGIMTKHAKGWTGAKTTTTDTGKEVRHRYLFAIEDPFELDHNVARTVTHNGIVAIRDEFRRAWRIVSAIGKGVQPEGGIFDEVVIIEKPKPAQKDNEKTATAEKNGVIDGAKPQGSEQIAAAEPPQQSPVPTALG